MKEMTAYRIVEVKNGRPHTLFHGVNGRRELPTNVWVRARDDRLVRDGTGPWYKPGFNVLFDREACGKYLERFTAPRDLRIIEIKVRGEIRPKSHSRSPVFLASEMRIPWPVRS